MREWRVASSGEGRPFPVGHFFAARRLALAGAMVLLFCSCRDRATDRASGAKGTSPGMTAAPVYTPPVEPLARLPAPDDPGVQAHQPIADGPIESDETPNGRPINGFPVSEGDSPIFPAGKLGQSPAGKLGQSPSSSAAPTPTESSDSPPDKPAGLSPKDGKAQPKAAGLPEYPLQDNPLAGCSLCHVDVEDEFVGTLHFEEKVGCTTCHGPSEAHLADENNEVKPDELFARENVDRLCERCHECPRPASKTPELTPDGKPKVCTDCHGPHDAALLAADATASTPPKSARIALLDDTLSPTNCTGSSGRAGPG